MKYCLLFLCLAIFTAPLRGQEHPRVYVNQQEIDAVKAKITAQAEPWYSAYLDVLGQASAALGMAPQSVTYQSGDQHGFSQELSVALSHRAEQGQRCGETSAGHRYPKAGYPPFGVAQELVGGVDVHGQRRD